MVRQGLVISIDEKTLTGIIQDKKNRHFFFSVNECHGLRMPALFSKVTFIKDTDFKSTDVASLVKPEHFAKVS